MKFGIVVTDDDEIWYGEKGVGDYVISRLTERNATDNTGEFVAIHAISRELPTVQDIITYAGFVFTGSHYSVNEDKQWIRNLEVFIRQVYNASLQFGRPRMVGICFGHQLIAKALGGTVGPNPDNKFNFGSVDVKVCKDAFTREFYQTLNFTEKCRKSFCTTISLIKFHGECVIDRPQMATHVGISHQCKNEMLLYGNTALTTQGHPEYTKKVMVDTNSKIMSRIGRMYPEDIKKSLDTINETDSGLCTDMILSFLHRYVKVTNH